MHVNEPIIVTVNQPSISINTSSGQQTIDMNNYFTEQELVRLSPYIREDEYSDDLLQELFLLL